MIAKKSPAFVQCGQRVGQVVQRVVDLFSLAVQVVSGRFDEVAERTPRLLRSRTQLPQNVVDRLPQLIPLDGHPSAAERYLRAVFQNGSAVVRRRQLDGARGHQAGIEDRRGGIGGTLYLLL